MAFEGAAGHQLHRRVLAAVGGLDVVEDGAARTRGTWRPGRRRRCRCGSRRPCRPPRQPPTAAPTSRGCSPWCRAGCRWAGSPGAARSRRRAAARRRRRPTSSIGMSAAGTRRSGATDWISATSHSFSARAASRMSCGSSMSEDHSPMDWYITSPQMPSSSRSARRFRTSRDPGGRCDISAIVSPVAPFAVMTLGSVAGEALAVDGDPLLVLGDHLRAGHPVGLRLRQDLVPEVVRLEEVRVARVGPDLLAHRSTVTPQSQMSEPFLAERGSAHGGPRRR